MKGLSTLLLVSFAILLNACTGYQPIWTHSGSSLRAELPYDKYTIMGTGTGTSCQKYFLGFNLDGSEEGGTYRKAVRLAIKEKGGDHLINATSDISRTFIIIFLYHEECVTVEGLVIKFK